MVIGITCIDGASRLIDYSEGLGSNSGNRLIALVEKWNTADSLNTLWVILTNKPMILETRNSWIWKSWCSKMNSSQSVWYFPLHDHNQSRLKDVRGHVDWLQSAFMWLNVAPQIRSRNRTSIKNDGTTQIELKYFHCIQIDCALSADKLDGCIVRSRILHFQSVQDYPEISSLHDW